MIYASLGLSGDIPLLLNACWTTFTLIGNTWTALYIDRFGRRRFMLIGSIGCVVSVIFLCAITASFLNTDNKAGLRAGVFFIWFYIVWWCFFIDATQYVYVAEIFPNHMRPAGVAMGVGSLLGVGSWSSQRREDYGLAPAVTQSLIFFASAAACEDGQFTYMDPPALHLVTR